MSEEDLRFSERYRERLQWDEDIYKTIQGKRPDAKYGVLSEFMRHAIKDTTQCALFCGGLKCKYDNPEHWKPEQMEINGLFSNWITDNIVAISRPSNKVIEDYGLIQQFKDAGIQSIINLQTPGEHASCGPPLDPSGFSYNPQTFMDNDIFFYNFGWPDYGVGSLSNILDMVKVTQFALSEGKIAVHCHAGLGRTGVLIATYLVYANRMDPHEVVHYIRSKRQGAIQTRNQVATIEEFGAYLKPLRVVFSSVEKDTYDFTLPQYMIRQKHMLHGLEAKNLKHIPKIIFVICERLMELTKRKSHRKRYQRNSLKIMKETAPSAFNNRRSKDTRNGLKPSQSSTLLAPPGGDIGSSLKTSKSMDNLALSTGRLRGSHGSSPRMRHKGTLRNSNSSNFSDSDSGFSKDSTDFNTNGYNSRYGAEEHTGLKVGIAETVAQAMAESEYSDEVYDKVEMLKKDLNADLRTWQKLGEENDSRVLSKLMWDWLDHLKEPILTAQDLPQMLRYTDNPPEGLQQLDKVTRTTIEYLFGILTRLQPLSKDTEAEVMQRILSTLTHQHMCAEYTVNSSIASNVSRRTMNTGEMSNNMVWRMMQFFVRYLTMCKEVQNEMRENLGEGDKNESSSNSSKYEYDETKPRNSRERKEPIGGEIEENDRRYQENETLDTRKAGKKVRKVRQRSRSNQNETFND